MSDEPTAEDLSLDPAGMLKTCKDRLRHGWHDLPMFSSACATIAALCRRLIAAEAEVARLRQQVEGHCERIAAASEVIARNAERSPLARLEAWQAADAERWLTINSDGVWWVELCDAEDRRVEAFGCHDEEPEMPNRLSRGTTYVGTSERLATLAECIDAALTLWERLYDQGDEK